MLCLRMKLKLSLATYHGRKIEKFNNKIAQHWFHQTSHTVSKADADRGGGSDVITRDVTKMRVEGRNADCEHLERCSFMTTFLAT